MRFEGLDDLFFGLSYFYGWALCCISGLKSGGGHTK